MNDAPALRRSGPVAVLQSVIGAQHANRHVFDGRVLIHVNLPIFDNGDLPPSID
jgi:hypothetical protein